MVSFHVGQKVVCIDDGWNKATDPFGNDLDVPMRVPMLKEVLEIDRIEEHFGVPLLGFVEIVNLWDHRCFRPVIERKTSIEIFTSMLNKPTVKVPA
jgi:hypothetical protein